MKLEPLLQDPAGQYIAEQFDPLLEPSERREPHGEIRVHEEGICQKRCDRRLTLREDPIRTRQSLSVSQKPVRV